MGHPFFHTPKVGFEKVRKIVIFQLFSHPQTSKIFVIIMNMKVEIKNDIKDKTYTDIFMAEVTDISGRVMKLLEDKDISIRLVNSVYDIKPDKLDYYSISKTGAHTIQGIISEDEKCIAICKNNTDAKDLKKVIFHELGHFMDAYEKFGNIKSIYDLTYSSSSKFINAYREDLMEN